MATTLAADTGWTQVASSGSSYVCPSWAPRSTKLSSDFLGMQPAHCFGSRYRNCKDCLGSTEYLCHASEKERVKRKVSVLSKEDCHGLTWSCGWRQKQSNRFKPLGTSPVILKNNFRNITNENQISNESSVLRVLTLLIILLFSDFEPLWSIFYNLWLMTAWSFQPPVQHQYQHRTYISPLFFSSQNVCLWLVT